VRGPANPSPSHRAVLRYLATDSSDTHLIGIDALAVLGGLSSTFPGALEQVLPGGRRLRVGVSGARGLTSIQHLHPVRLNRIGGYSEGLHERADSTYFPGHVSGVLITLVTLQLYGPAEGTATPVSVVQSRGESGGTPV
jgi:hypothetical protein